MQWGGRRDEVQGHVSDPSLSVRVIPGEPRPLSVPQSPHLWCQRGQASSAPFPIPRLSWEDPLEKEMATHSSILPRRIPWTEEPGGLQSTGS